MSDSETASEEELNQPVAKRIRLSTINDNNDETDSGSSRPITPPPLRRGVVPVTLADVTARSTAILTKDVEIVHSPINLTKIRDTQDVNNVDTITLGDILGDPLIKEMWQFNFLIDIEFTMNALDPDVRDLVKVNIVHGFWKNDDQRQYLLEAASRYPNLKLITAYMPEAFGTHHTKMMVLFRHDDTAQIVIHTANMITQDWRNLTQAVWRSPLLPLLAEPQNTDDLMKRLEPYPVGTGMRFKLDFLKYISFYTAPRTGALSEKLEKYDFSTIKAALIASVPCKQKSQNDTQRRTTRSGWLGLQDIMPKIPTRTRFDERPVIVAQVSSIATLGATTAWIDSFFTTLNDSSKAFGKAPIRRIIFPNTDEVRRSHDGYASGSSIHTKIQSKAQAKQVDYLRPLLCYWAGDADGLRPSTAEVPVREAGRRRAAPHIKTYVRFTNKDMSEIDWAMVTSANLSTQAWGTLPNKDGEVKISSYELGVVVWPALFDEPDAGSDLTGQGKSVMVPTFKKDDPSPQDAAAGNTSRVVGFRMPYDLPLVRYADEELPWCATAQYEEPDNFGRSWPGFGGR